MASLNSLDITILDTNVFLFAGIKRIHNEMFTAANGDREDAPNLVIVVTDREGDLQNAVKEATLAKEKGITLQILGVGEQVSIKRFQVLF